MVRGKAVAREQEAAEGMCVGVEGDVIIAEGYAVSLSTRSTASILGALTRLIHRLIFLNTDIRDI